jgi:hypothetical protein
VSNDSSRAFSGRLACCPCRVSSFPFFSVQRPLWEPSLLTSEHCPNARGNVIRHYGGRNKKTLNSYDPFHHFNFLANADGPLWEPYTSRQGSSCHVYTSSWLGHFLFWVYIAWYLFLDMYPPQWYPDGPFLSTRTWKLSSSCSRYRFVVFFSLHPSLTLLPPLLNHIHGKD